MTTTEKCEHHVIRNMDGTVAGCLRCGTTKLETRYFAHRWQRRDGLVFVHVQKHTNSVKLYGEGEIFEVTVRPIVEGEQSNYWGWCDAVTGEYSMVYPSEPEARCCYPYGPEAEERRGRGKFLNLVVEKV